MKRYLAARAIQARWRGYFTRTGLDAYLKRRHAAGAMLQAWWRRRIAYVALPTEGCGSRTDGLPSRDGNR